jgi:pimeloyl-ACP methyl ester carboxylesterase
MLVKCLALPIVAVALLAACSSDANPIATDSDSTVATTDAPDTTDAPETTPVAETVEPTDSTQAPDTTEPVDTQAPVSTDAPDTTTPTTSGPGDDPFGWEEFFFGEGVEVGTLEVPIDYDDPSKGTFELYVARRLASNPSERIGSLLVNPGGPGFGGSDFALYADQIYSEELLEHFDIVGWDPRGTGLSEPAIDCIDDYDRYFATGDITPDDDAERQQIIDLAQEFQTLCAENNADILPFIGTNNSARDMDSIRRALGEDTITYFGFSYGSELGATWATLFPDTVRAAVLDGAADPNADFVESSLQQVRGFEASIATFLAQCSADPDCAFHNDGDAEGAFDALMLQIDENPVPSEPDRPDVTRGVALTGVAQAMYSETLWDELEEALADAQDGDGSGLLALYDQYYVRHEDGTYDNSLEAFQSISCMDTPERPTVEEEDAEAPLFNEAAPRFAPGTTGSYFCSFFPESIDPRVEITGAGAGPILVVGTTGDPATPLSSTENMAEALEEGVLLVIEADQHTGYGVNACSYDTIDSYLVDLEIPEDGFVCEA